MSRIIVVSPKSKETECVRNMLMRYGMEAAVCSTASRVLSLAHQAENGVVICSFQIRDMHYSQLAEYLPEYFELLLLASPAELENCPLGMMVLTYPVKAHDLAGTVEMMLAQQARRLKKNKRPVKKRTEEEQNYINNAKLLLMERNCMSEQEAFRYIQKCSMDSGTDMAETAQMVLMLMYDG